MWAPQKLNLLITDEQFGDFAAEVLQSHDPDGDRRISKEEFLSLYTHVVRPSLVFGPCVARPLPCFGLLAD